MKKETSITRAPGRDMSGTYDLLGSLVDNPTNLEQQLGSYSLELDVPAAPSSVLDQVAPYIPFPDNSLQESSLLDDLKKFVAEDVLIERPTVLTKEELSLLAPKPISFEEGLEQIERDFLTGNYDPDSVLDKSSAHYNPLADGWVSRVDFATPQLIAHFGKVPGKDVPSLDLPQFKNWAAETSYGVVAEEGIGHRGDGKYTNWEKQNISDATSEGVINLDNFADLFSEMKELEQKYDADFIPSKRIAGEEISLKEMLAQEEAIDNLVVPTTSRFMSWINHLGEKKYSLPSLQEAVDQMQDGKRSYSAHAGVPTSTSLKETMYRGAKKVVFGTALAAVTVPLALSLLRVQPYDAVAPQKTLSELRQEYKDVPAAPQANACTVVEAYMTSGKRKVAVPYALVHKNGKTVAVPNPHGIFTGALPDGDKYQQEVRVHTMDLPHQNPIIVIDQHYSNLGDCQVTPLWKNQSADKTPENFGGFSVTSPTGKTTTVPVQDMYQK